MRAMIFAAGMGTRLKPFTDSHPKALVPIGGIPALEIVLRRLKAAGVTEAVVNVHHFAEQIVDFLRKNDNFGLDIAISDETDRLLETGGGVLKARHWLEDEDFLVHNADIITNLEVAPLFDYHSSSPRQATLVVSPRQSNRQLYFDENGRLHGWHNSATDESRPANFIPSDKYNTFAFNGIHVMSPSIFPTLEKYADKFGPAFSITDFYLANCEEHKYYGYRPTNAETQFVDVGKPENLPEADALAKTIIEGYDKH